MSDIALRHVEHLSVAIGPRGSTTSKERDAHDYIQKTLNDLGVETRRDEFPSSTSAYMPFALAMALMLVAVWLFVQLGSLGALAAAALGAITVASVFLELTLRDNPLHWFLPLGASQNVIGMARPEGEVRRRLVLVAHADTHRSGLLWRTPATFAVYRLVTTLGVISLVAAEVIFIIGMFAYSETLRTAVLVPAAVFALTLLMVLQGHFTRFTPGANDNASGVGVLLSIAERLKREPLPGAEVWFVSTGCEEVGAYGMRDFVRRYHKDLHDAVILNVDNVAGKDTGAVHLRSETFLLPWKYPADLLALADQIAAERPDLSAYGVHQAGAYTDGGVVLNAGLRAFTMVGYTRKGWIPNWHHPNDTFANIDRAALDQTEQFVWEMMKRMAAGS